MYRESRQPVFTEVSVKEAETFLAINNFPGQRRLDARKAQRIAERMKSGTQRRLDFAMTKVKETGESFLMNGQHCARGLVLYGRPYSALVSYYLCDTMNDAWRLFATFDVHTARTEQQFMKAARGLFEDERLHTVPLKVLQSCGAALFAIGDAEDESPKFKAAAAPEKTLKAEAVAKHPEDVLFVAEFAEYRHLTTVGAAAAMIVTNRKNHAAAGEFWPSVANGDMLHRTDPRFRLREALRDSRGMPANGTVRQDLTYKTCIVWWNAWRTKQPRAFVRVRGMNAPVRVAD